LGDKTEKGIFFLESMETFRTMIWGFINVPDPPNYAKALSVINNCPKYNSEPYYQNLGLNFIEIKIEFFSANRLITLPKRHLPYTHNQ